MADLGGLEFFFGWDKQVTSNPKETLATFKLH
jgi:hypothetical protein